MLDVLLRMAGSSTAIGRGIDFQEVLRTRHGRTTSPAAVRGGRRDDPEGVDAVTSSRTKGRTTRIGQTERSTQDRPQRPHPPGMGGGREPSRRSSGPPPGVSGWRRSSCRRPWSERSSSSTSNAAVRAGRDVSPSHVMLVRNVYVAPTDEEAVADAEPALTHMLILFKDAAVPRRPVRDAGQLRVPSRIVPRVRGTAGELPGRASAPGWSSAARPRRSDVSCRSRSRRSAWGRSACCSRSGTCPTTR